MQRRKERSLGGARPEAIIARSVRPKQFRLHKLNIQSVYIVIVFKILFANHKGS